MCCQQLSLIIEILQQSRTHCVQTLQQQTSPSHQLSQQYNEFQSFELTILNYVSDVAMRALDQNVSTLAAQTLNTYQIQNEDGTLDREEPFISRCMNCLNECTNTVNDLSSLRTINRISVLLRSHLELFMRRYSYVIHLYQYLSQSNSNTLGSNFSLKPHIKQVTCSDDRETNLLKLICNAPISTGGAEKFILRMNPNEYIGDLRAELTRWYLTIKPNVGNVLTQTLLTAEKNESNNSTTTTTTTSTANSELTQISSLPSIRVVANGQELDRDMDDKTLSECGIKDNQTILVNGSTRNRSKDFHSIEERLLKSYIPQKMPMFLLLKYIEQIFSILAQLQTLIETSNEHTEARTVVQRLWEIVLCIPTHNGILQKLTNLAEFSENENNSELWSNYLQRTDPFRFTYSLQIIDMLIRRTIDYKEMFVRKGGLKFLYELFISKSFFTGPIDRSWCSGLPDALLYALKILSSCLLKVPTPISQPTVATQTSVPPPPPTAPPSDDQHSPRTAANSRKKVMKRFSSTLVRSRLSFSFLSKSNLDSTRNCRTRDHRCPFVQ